MDRPTITASHPFEQRPKFLVRDNDAKFPTQFQRVADDTAIKILKTPFQSPNANAICERLMRSIRQECLDPFVILNEGHLSKILKKYVEYFNHYRPHQGVEQVTPIKPESTTQPGGKIVGFPVLGRLHHYYERVA